jgi:hypothetical protein
MGDRPIHPATAAILQHFEYKHLPEHLQPVSRQFFDMAHRVAKAFDGPELTAGLRKLLEAKDCVVRAAVEQRRTADEAAPAVRSCGNCKTPFNEADRRADGDAEYDNSGYCRDCIDNCHEGGADHRCVICVPKADAR